MNPARILYFLRHGLADREAFTGTDDRLRPLTAEGRSRLRQAGGTLRRAGWRPDVLLTSPLARAVQTAEIVAEETGLGDRLLVEESLDCGFGVEDLRRLLARYKGAGEIALVGHEPDFSATVAALTVDADLETRLDPVFRAGHAAGIVFKKGSLARVDLIDEEKLVGELVWLVPPKFLAL